MTGEFLGLSMTVWTIIGAAIVTYAARAGGHLVLSRFRRIPPRVDAALNAVPAAVLATLVAPAAVTSAPARAIQAPDRRKAAATILHAPGRGRH
jgi:uncharacterized membrane protein